MGLVDFRDPESIRRWLAVAPQRHRAQLRALYRLWPQFAKSMTEGATS